MTYHQLEAATVARLERERDAARQLVARMLFLVDEARYRSGQPCPFCGAVEGHTSTCPAETAFKTWYPPEMVGGVE